MKSQPLEFARLYEAQYQDFTEDLPFWIGMLQRFGDPVLELGCGSGRVSGSLLNAGAMILGLDNDPTMLQLARMHLARFPEHKRLRGSLVCMDMLAIGLHKHYALAIAPLNTLATFDDAGFPLVLHNIAQLLGPGGALVCDLPNPSTALDPDHDPEDVLDDFVLDDEGLGVQVRARISTTSQPGVHHVEWIYEIIRPDGSADRITLEESYHLRTPEELAAHGYSAGFTDFEIYGDYDLTAFRKDSPRLLVGFQRHP